MITCDITEVTPAKYAEEAQSFIALMQGLQMKPSQYKFTTKAEGEAGPAPKVDKKYFSERAAKSEGIAESYSENFPGKRYVARAMNGAQVYGLVGLMILQIKDEEVYIDFLSTHPLSNNAGVLLIEHAIDISKKAGKGGRVGLFDASGGRFYDNLGFVPKEAGSSEKVLRDGKLAPKPE